MVKSINRKVKLLQTISLLGLTLLIPLAEPKQVHSQAIVSAPLRSAKPLNGSLKNSYVIGPGDQLELTLLDPGAKDLSGTVEVLNDGSVSLALLGDVIIEGLTLEQASQWISKLYGRYLIRPDLTLKIGRARPIQVSVVGEVENPGIYSLTNADTGEALDPSKTKIYGLPTVATAIQKAGGITLNADIKDVVLRRRIPGRGKEETEINLNLMTLLDKGDKAQNPFLFDGDSITIKRTTTPADQSMALAAANLSPKTISVNVVGEVVAPGRIELKPNTPVMQAILTAGGPKAGRAAYSNIELIRVNRDNTLTHQILTLSYANTANDIKNPPLKNGDTVVVHRGAYAAATDAIGAITSPLGGLSNLLLLRDLF
jgi:polysaccharide export outer membrane protein